MSSELGNFDEEKTRKRERERERVSEVDHDWVVMKTENLGLEEREKAE